MLYNKNKATGIACLTFKCKLAFPTIFNDIHKRVLLILSIYQIVLYRCLQENKVSFTNQKSKVTLPTEGSAL